MSATIGVGSNQLVTFNWNPATQLTHFLAAEAAVQKGTPGASAKIIALGDSTTAGVDGSTNFRQSTSYPAQLALDLAKAGLPTQYDNFLGGGLLVDSRITFIGTARWSGAQAAGGQVIQTTSVGDGLNFTLNAPGRYDRVDISYIDSYNGSANISVNGGPVITTLHLGGTGNMKTQTVDLPAGSYSSLSITQADGQPLFIEGASFWNSTAPAIQVYNAGIGGTASDIVGNGSTSGSGEIPGAVGIGPKLALIDYGINDINNAQQTTAQTVANISLMVAAFRSAGCDPIIIIPEPFVSGNYATQIPALRAALQAFSLAQNVPLIDLSATYGNDPSIVQAANLMSDNLHPNDAFYADIGQAIANLLTTAPMPVPQGGTSPVTTPPVTTPPVTTPPVTTTPTPTAAPVTIGTGPNSMMLSISEDAWQGDAQFTISVDGTQIGGTQTATASHAAHAEQTFTVNGTFAAGQHVVSVNFVNDAYGGSPSTDRNLYVDSIAYNGSTLATAAVFLDGGAQSFTIGTATPVTTPPVTTPPVTSTPTPTATPVTIGSGPNSMVLSISEDAWQGDAQFTVSVDGTQIGGTQTATASHAAGADQAFTVNGTFAAGQHAVSVNFVNDAYGGSPSTDRNLYVDAIAYNGTTLKPAAVFLDGGAQSFTVGTAAPVTTPPVTTPTTSDTLLLNLSEDAWQGDAQFTVSMDGTQIGGTQTVSALQSSGDASVFILTGHWGGGPHAVQIQFTNDAYGGSPSTDRNLYVNSIAYDGVSYAGTTATMLSAGTDSFTVGGNTPVATAPADTLTLHLAEDAWQGNAQFSLSIDGKTISTPQDVVALHSAGAWQDVSFSGNFGAGSHTIGITFANDAYGGSTSTDRNLYINGIDLNGQHYGSGTTTLMSNGTANFTVTTAH